MRPIDGYIRVSRVSGREGDSFISPGEQRRAIEGWASLHSREIERIFEDLDESGKARNRPGLDAAMERIESGVTGGVVVAKLDRFGRSVPHLGELLSILDANDAALYTVAEGLDTGGHTGRMIATILSAIAEFEVNRISESWTVARRNAVQRGVFVGGTVPIGYEKVDGRLRPGPDAEIAREVFRRRASGHSWKSIADYLADATGRRSSVESVRYLVRNRTYLGEIDAGGGAINLDAHEPLVDRETFEAANVRQTAIRSDSGRAKGLVTGILRCASCRYALRFSMGRTRHGKPRADYRCKAGSRSAGGCPSPASISSNSIEPHLVEEFLRRAARVGAGEIESASGVPEAIARVERAEAELRTLLDSNLSAILGSDSSEFLRAVEERKREVDTARAELATLRAGVAVLPDVTLVDTWPDLTFDEHRSLLSAAFECVFVRPGGRIPERVFIPERGAGIDLPVRGSRWTPREFRFPPPASSSGEDAGELATDR